MYPQELKPGRAATPPQIAVGKGYYPKKHVKVRELGWFIQVKKWMYPIQDYGFAGGFSDFFVWTWIIKSKMHLPEAQVNLLLIPKYPIFQQVVPLWAFSRISAQDHVCRGSVRTAM